MNPQTKAPKGATKPMASGIGESRRFIAAEGDMEKPEPVIVNGKEVDEAFAHVLPKHYDDAEVSKRLETQTGSGVTVGDGPFEKHVQQRRDFGREHHDSDAMPDHMREIMKAHVPPGFHGRFLSKAVCDTKGLRGWEPVAGAPEVGGMFLGRKPVEIARKQRTSSVRKHEERMRETETKDQAIGVPEERWPTT